jgi:hypothetical protein
VEDPGTGFQLNRENHLLNYLVMMFGKNLSPVLNLNKVLDVTSATGERLRLFIQFLTKFKGTTKNYDDG